MSPRKKKKEPNEIEEIGKTIKCLWSIVKWFVANKTAILMIVGLFGSGAGGYLIPQQCNTEHKTTQMCLKRTEPYLGEKPVKIEVMNGFVAEIYSIKTKTSSDIRIKVLAPQTSMVKDGSEVCIPQEKFYKADYKDKELEKLFKKYNVFSTFGTAVYAHELTAAESKTTELPEWYKGRKIRMFCHVGTNEDLQLVKVYREGDGKCFKETIDTETGEMVKREWVNCDPICGNGNVKKFKDDQLKLRQAS